MLKPELLRNRIVIHSLWPASKSKQNLKPNRFKQKTIPHPADGIRLKLPMTITAQ